MAFQAGTGTSFGLGTPAAAGSQPASSGFGFGQNPKPTTGFQGFGGAGSSSGTAAPSTSFNFSSGLTQPAAGTGQGLTSSTGLFGSSSAGTSSGFGTTGSAGGFGLSQSSVNAGQQPAGGLFGSSQAAGTGMRPGQQGGGAFGLGQSGVGFGLGQQSGTGLSFGQPAGGGLNLGQQAGGAFGQQANSFSGSGAPLAGQQQPGSSGALGTLQQIIQAYDRNSPYSPFWATYYNVVDPQTAADPRARLPPQNFDPRVWARALENMPDPSRMVTTVAYGFEGTVERIHLQAKRLTEQTNALKQIDGALSDLSKRVDNSAKVRLNEIRKDHDALTHRLLRVRKVMDVLRGRGTPYIQDEARFRKRLETLESELMRPRGPVAKMNDLKPRVERLSSHFGDIGVATDASLMPEGEHNLKELAKALKQQREALFLLAESVNRCSRDLSTLGSLITPGKGSGQAHVMLSRSATEG